MPFLSKTQEEQPSTVILERSMDPPYARATVEGDVRKLIRAYYDESRERTLTINDVKQYIEYLGKRYPKLEPLARVTPRLFQGDRLEAYFEPALKNYNDFVRQQQSEINTKRSTYLIHHSRCQVCSFGFTPLLQVHHVVPTSEGGDNRLLVVLCPTCHKLIHRLITIKSNTRRQELLEFDWWTHKDDVAEWWVKARTNIDAIIDLYHTHLKYESFELFLQQFVQKNSSKYPFIIISSLSKQQILAKELFR